jgi:SnoaL-like protein
MTGPSVEDRLAIMELYARYSWALDTGDTDAYVALFTRDGEAEETQTGHVARGHEEIRGIVAFYHDDPAFPGHQHRIDSLVLDPDPQGRPDHWAARSYTLASITPQEGDSRVYWSGWNDDVVAREDGVWRIRYRGIHPWRGAVLDGFTARGSA